MIEIVTAPTLPVAYLAITYRGHTRVLENPDLVEALPEQLREHTLRAVMSTIQGERNEQTDQARVRQMAGPLRPL